MSPPRVQPCPGTDLLAQGLVVRCCDLGSDRAIAHISLLWVLMLSAWKLVDLVRALYVCGRSLFCGGCTRLRVSIGSEKPAWAFAAGQQVWVYTTVP